jgi:hypothetical protein
VHWRALSDEARNGQRVLLFGGIRVSGTTETDAREPVLAAWTGAEWVVVDNVGSPIIVRGPTHWCPLPGLPRGREHLSIVPSEIGTEIERRALACLRRWDWRRKGCLAGSDIARELNEDVFLIHDTLAELERRGFVEHVGITPNSGFVWRETVRDAA